MSEIQESSNSHKEPCDTDIEQDHDFEDWFYDLKKSAKGYKINIGIDTNNVYKDLYDQGLTVNQALYLTHPVDKSVLGPMGVQKVSKGIQEWADQNITDIHDLMGTGRIKGRIRSFREQDHEMITLDMSSEQHSRLYQILITTGFYHDFHKTEPSAPDAPEALHMLSLVAKGLDIEITLA